MLCNFYVRRMLLSYVNNMILLGNFYYRNWHTLALADETSWSEIEKTPIMIHQPPKDAQITHLIRPNSYQPDKSPLKRQLLSHDPLYSFN